MDADDAHCRHMDVKLLSAYGFKEENAYFGNAVLLVTCLYHYISSGNLINNKTLNNFTTVK